MPAARVGVSTREHHGSDASPAPPKKQQMTDLTLCFSLCSLFDFDKSGMVTQEDWIRGMQCLMLDDLGNDPKMWAKMTEMHGVRDGGKAMVDVNRLADIVPIDPRVAVLLNAVVKGLVGMRDFVERSFRKETKEAEVKQSRALINIRRRILHPVLHAWKTYVTQNKNLLRKSAGQGLFYKQHKAFRQWKYARELCIEERLEARRQARQNKKLAAAAGRFMNAKMSIAWNSWKAMYVERRKMLKIFGKLKYRAASLAWNSWLELLTERDRMKRFFRRLMNMELARSFSSWLSHLDDLAEQARLIGSDCAREERSKSSVVRRFLLKDVGRALNHWTGLWRERQRFKLIGRRMGFDGGLSRAWRQWEYQAADDQRRKGIIGRFANVGLTRALNRWLESLEERRLMRHFLKRAMNGGLARALTSWYETMHQAKKDHARRARFGAKFLKLRELRAWNCWLGLLEERARLKVVARRMMQVGVVRAINQWCAYLDGQERLRGLATRFTNSPTVKAFNSWVAALGELRKLRGIFGRALDGRLSRAFNQWLDSNYSINQLAKFGARMANAVALRAWNQWIHVCAEMGRLRVFGRRMLMQAASKAINTWVEFVDEQARLRRFGLRLLHRNVIKALNTWEVEAGKRRRMRAFLGRILNTRVAQAWNQWTGAADEHNRMVLFASKMLQQQSLKAWNKWYAQIATFWRLQEVAHRMMNLGVLRAFETWLSVREKDTKMSRRERAWMTMFKMRKLTRAWRLWRTNAHEQVARGRIRDTFHFSKKAAEEETFAEAVDWRKQLNSKRTKA